MDDYQKKLKAFRVWNTVGIGAIVVFVACAISRGLMTSLPPALENAILIVSGASLFIAGISMLKVVLFKCPRCGNLFMIKNYFYRKPTGRECPHCHLPAGY